MSQAYQSVLAISFDVRGGLLIRQVHHWSADLFVAAIILRLLRGFFRGRFCGRALPDWLIWVTLLPLGMLAASTGTILPDDGLSGGSLGVITGVLLSVPVIGTHLAFWIFGGAPPGHQIIGSDYWVHLLVLPVLAWASTRWRTGGSRRSAAARAAAARTTRPGEPDRGRAWPASCSTGCCGPRQPMSRSPTTCTWTSTWSPGAFRVLVLAGLALAFGLTRVICHALASRRRDEERHGRESGRIVDEPARRL